MADHLDWLPGLLTMNGCGGWDGLLKAAYNQFNIDFIQSCPSFQGRRVKIRRAPVTKDKEACFWHLIQEGESEEERTPSIPRCERLAWVRKLIEGVDDPECGLKVWSSIRQTKAGPSRHWAIALPDFSYMVALRDDGDSCLLLTAFPVERQRRQEKLARSYDDWCQEQKRRAQNS